MGLVKHDKIVAALERRALRYRKGGKFRVDQDKVLYDEALDETRTVSTEELADLDSESWDDRTSAGMSEVLKVQELAGVADELLEVYGVAPGKAEGITRLIYENVDGLQNRIGGNKKFQKIKDLADELEVSRLSGHQ